MTALAVLSRSGRTPPIDVAQHPTEIAALEPVVLGGVEQRILVRGEDAANPLVLFLHGGPGTSQIGLNRRNTAALERWFTVVNWDQRLAGKSFAAGRDRSGLCIDRFVDDAIALATSLRERFGQPNVTLVGHSWGSVLGVLAAQRRPDLFASYVGIGQMSDMAESERLSYAWTLEQARAAGARSAVRRLEAIGPPPYDGDWRRGFLTQRRLLARFGGECYGSRRGAFGVVLRSLLTSCEYTVVDRVNYFRGILRSLAALGPELLRVDLFATVPELELPVFFCLGRHDHEVPAELAARYFETLRAPEKELVWFERSGHMPNTEQRDLFNAFMVEQVLPVARRSAADIRLAQRLPGL